MHPLRQAHYPATALTPTSGKNGEVGSKNTGNFNEARKAFSGKTFYAEWQFVFVPATLTSASNAKK